jgi:hypothetical protein
MRYYNLNKTTPSEYSNPVLIQVNRKAEKLLERLAKLECKQKKLKEQIIEELSELNMMDYCKMKDLLNEYDLKYTVLVESNGYTLCGCDKEIDKEAYVDYITQEEDKMDNLIIRDNIDFLCTEISLRASDLINAMQIDKNQDYSWQIERLCKYITLIKDLVKEIK